MKMKTRIMAFILTIVMVISVMPAATAQVKAAGELIDLGAVTWNAEKSEYYFQNATANFGDVKQKIFCLSVDNEGSFKVPDSFSLGDSTTKITGIDASGSYVSAVSGGAILSSLTVIGNNITNSEIETFVENLVFYRNGVGADAEQKVSVVANSVELESDMTAMAIDGVIHYYRYVDWVNANSKGITYADSDMTWYKAYAEAKSDTWKFNGMKGYLATITSSMEQNYIYKNINMPVTGAWAGGARTLDVDKNGVQIPFDGDSITGLYPKVQGETGIPNTWRWVCGPETGKVFYTLNSTNPWFSTGVSNMFTHWSSSEPNNKEGVPDEFNQEYCLQYGYQSAGDWNDYYPSCSTKNLGSYGVGGYLIEYSPYTVKNPDGTDKETIEETTNPSYTDFEVVSASRITMSAKDIILKVSETGSSFDDAKAKEKTDVKADNNGTTISHSDPSITVTDGLSDVQSGKKGSYELEFTYSSKTTTSKVTVVDEVTTGTGTDGKETSIGANDFCISKAQAQAIKADPTSDAVKALVRTLANAVAIHDGTIIDSSLITDIDVSAINPDAAGPHNVMFTYNGVSVTVKATVKDDGATDGVSDDKTRIPNTNLTANDFSIEKGSTALDKDSFIEKAKVEANKNYGSKVTDINVKQADLDALNNAIQNGPAGTYTVEVEAGGEYTTVTVTVTEKYPNIAANDFIISTKDIKDDKADSSDEIKTLSGAKRYRNPGEEENTDKVKVDSDSIEALNSQTTAGIVSITFGDDTPSPNTADSKTVKAIVVDETTVSPGGTIVIGANNFNITMEQAKTVENDAKDGTLTPETQAMLKTLANASATDNHLKVDTEVASTTIKAENGRYTVTFSYGGQSVTVMATVKDDGGANIPGDVTVPDTNLTGNDFVVEGPGTALTEDKFKKLADIAAKKNDGTIVTVDVNDSELGKLNDAITQGKKGDYNVTVTAPDGTTATITVTVTDKASDKKNDNSVTGETIAANNFVIGVDDYAKIVADASAKENVIKLSNAIAYNNETKADVVISSVDVSKVKNEPGTYPITLSTANGTTTTINVTIDKDWKTIGDVDKASDSNKTSTTTENNTAQKNTGNTDSSKPGDTTGDDKVYEISNPKDVTQDLDKGREVEKVTVDGTDIPASSYTVSGDTLVIKDSVFAGKKEGTYPVVVTYKDGSKKTFNVKVVPYDESTVVTKVPIFHMQKDIGVGKKFKLNLVGMNKNAVKKFKSSNNKIATIDKNGVIKAKKKGKCTITASVIQKGSYYTVKIKLIVKKSMKMYNLKNAALTKQQGELPEFNVYKRVVKGKKTKMDFTNITKDAKITYTSSNKKIASVSKKGIIKGKKKGFTVITAKIEQSGKVYYTRLFVRVDDGTKNKLLKKYLK